MGIRRLQSISAVSGQKKFYQYPNNIALPYKARKEINAGYRLFRQPIKFKDKIYVIMTDSSQVDLHVLDKNLNIIQSLGAVQYASFWTVYQNFGISKRFNKLIRLKSSSGSYYIACHNIDSAGNIGSEVAKYINNYGSFSNSLIIDDDNDKFYFVWGSTLYCYQISTFNALSNPLWSVGLPWQPSSMKLYGNILIIANYNTNYGTRIYTVSDSGITQIAQSTTILPDDFFFDGTHLYVIDVSNRNVVKKYDINLNSIATSGNYMMTTRPLSELIDKIVFATNKLIDGKIHLLTNYSVLIIDPNTLAIENEYLLFDPAVTPHKISGVIYYAGWLPNFYYDVDDGEMIFTHFTSNYYYDGSYFVSESKSRLTVLLLKY
jgi:hypothetical protein